VEKIHHTWSNGSDATVLDDYALTVDDDDDDGNAKRPFVGAATYSV